MIGLQYESQLPPLVAKELKQLIAGIQAENLALKQSIMVAAASAGSSAIKYQKVLFSNTEILTLPTSGTLPLLAATPGVRHELIYAQIVGDFRNGAYGNVDPDFGVWSLYTNPGTEGGLSYLGTDSSIPFFAPSSSPTYADLKFFLTTAGVMVAVYHPISYPIAAVSTTPGAPFWGNVATVDQGMGAGLSSPVGNPLLLQGLNNAAGNYTGGHIKNSMIAHLLYLDLVDYDDTH